MPRLDNDRLDTRPVFLEILAKRLTPRVIQARGKQAEQIAGTVLIAEVMRGIERGDHRLEQMHLRVLPARQCRRNTLDIASMRRAQLAVEKGDQRIHLAAKAGISA